VHQESPPAEEAPIDEVGLAFEVLGLVPSAAQDEVKAGFRALAKEWHPDRKSSSAAGSAREITGADGTGGGGGRRVALERREVAVDGPTETALGSLAGAATHFSLRRGVQRDNWSRSAFAYAARAGTRQGRQPKCYGRGGANKQVRSLLSGVS
jgi:hypothetical protein